MGLPEAFAVSGYDRIPAELRERNQWIVWKRETGPDGKPTKPRYRTDGKGNAKSGPER